MELFNSALNNTWNYTWPALVPIRHLRIIRTYVRNWMWPRFMIIIWNHCFLSQFGYAQDCRGWVNSIRSDRAEYWIGLDTQLLEYRMYVMQTHVKDSQSQCYSIILACSYICSRFFWNAMCFICHLINRLSFLWPRPFHAIHHHHLIWIERTLCWNLRFMTLS